MISLTKEERVFNRIACSIVHGSPLSSSEFEGVNWDELFSLIKKHKVFPSFYRTVVQHVPSEFYQKWVLEYTTYVNNIENIIAILKEVTSILSDAGLPYSVLKGIVLSKIIYDDVYSRHSNDIDLLFPETQMRYAFDILSEHGYFSAVGSDDAYHLGLEAGTYLLLPYPVLKGQDHHEYFELWKKVDSRFYGIEIQRYFHGEITDLSYIESFIESNRMIQVTDFVAPTLDFNHTLICLCENAYAEITEPHMNLCLKNYLDIGMFIKRFGKTLDWNEIVSLTRKYDVGHVLKQGLSFTNSIFGEIISPNIISSFESKACLNHWRYSIEEMLGMPQEVLQMELKRNKINYVANSKLPIIPCSDLVSIGSADQYHQANIRVESFELKIRYVVSQDKNKLRFQIYFENSALQIMIQHPLVLSFFDSGNETTEVLNHIYIDWDRKENKPYCGEAVIPVIDMDQKRVMILDIPLSKILGRDFEITDKVIFKFSVLSSPFFNIHHWYDTGWIDKFTEFIDRSIAVQINN